MNRNLKPAAMLLAKIELIDCYADSQFREAFQQLHHVFFNLSIPDSAVENGLQLVAASGNPYLLIWKRWVERDLIEIGAGLVREHAVKVFSWAIPNEECLAFMVKTSKHIVEIGAGNGYWARMLSDRGANIVAVDSSNDKDIGSWFPVLHNTGSQYMIDNAGCPDKALFLCWPHFLSGPRQADNMMKSLLRQTIDGRGNGGNEGDDEEHEEDEKDDIGETIDRFAGEWIFYVGEESGGCTYDIERRLGFSSDEIQFVESKSKTWERVHSIQIPTWPMIHDQFTAYRRISTV